MVTPTFVIDVRYGLKSGKDWTANDTSVHNVRAPRISEDIEAIWPSGVSNTSITGTSRMHAQQTDLQKDKAPVEPRSDKQRQKTWTIETLKFGGEMRNKF